LPALLALIAVTAGCRIDMHMQPYYRPMAKSDFFPDGRSARLPVDGTVARGDLRDFRELVHSLRSGAANVGGVRLCQNLTALRDVTAKDLRQMGPGYLETIESELARLENALEQAMLQARRG